MRFIFRTMLLLVLLLAVAVGYFAYTPMALPSTPFAFNLQSGSSLKTVAHQLGKERLLDQELIFVWLGRLSGKAGQIKTGEYSLSTPVNMMELLEIISKGQVNQSQLSVIEGWSFKQFRAAVDEHPSLKHNTQALSDVELLQRIGATEIHPEGLFFPDTYNFASGSSDVQIFKRAYETMQQRLAQAWAGREAGLPLATPYEALILASIVEKETGTPSDRDMIAGVFVNRLRRGMLLQTDPTVIYGMGDKFDGNIRRKDLHIDTQYNTYTRVGLPPTPIALPGVAALHAALHPAKTDALYFVARGDGSSQFSNNLAAHNRAVQRFQIK